MTSQPVKLTEITVRRSVSLFGHQNKFIEDFAKKKYEGNFSQALRFLIDKLMVEALKE